MKLNFWKMQHNGNDFVVIDYNEFLKKYADQKNEEEITTLLSKLAQKVAPWKFGVGSDGLLVAQAVSRDRVFMRMFGNDGAEDFCGNGLMCVSRHLYDQGLIDKQFDLEQFGHHVQVWIEDNGRIKAEFEKASFDSKDVPLDPDTDELVFTDIDLDEDTLNITSLSTGSTHTVIIRDQLPNDFYFSQMSGLLESDPVFPYRTNVMWIAPENDHRLKMRIWERGVGETFACGSGSVAAVTVWSRKSGVTGPMQIVTKGGETELYVDHWDKPVVMYARPQHVFTGEVEFEG